MLQYRFHPGELWVLLWVLQLDRFEMGDLRILHRVEGLAEEVQIHPRGHLQLFQEYLNWKERFGRGEDINRLT